MADNINAFFRGQYEPRKSNSNDYHPNPIVNAVKKMEHERYLELAEKSKSTSREGVLKPLKEDFGYVERAQKAHLREERREQQKFSLGARNAMNFGGSMEDIESLMLPESTVIQDDETETGGFHGYRTRSNDDGEMFYDKYLPVYKYKDRILEAVDQNSTILIKGGTASGKTTQVPQYLMDNCRQRRVNFNCVVTQPRKIAALSVCRYVNKVRKLTVGRLIGYQVGLQSEYTQGETQLTYVTTGVLLKHIVQTKTLSNFTHIILDEIHERDQDTDFAMLLVKKLRAKAPNVKIILMSATCDTELFVDYFKSSASGPVTKPPCIIIESRTHPVDVYYLENFAKLYQPQRFESLQFEKESPAIDQYQVEVAIKLIQHFDEVEHRSGRRTRGGVLVFLPGWADMSDMYDRMCPLMERNNWKIYLLHSEKPLKNQDQMFERVDEKCRKVILSTNIAESSITVCDVLYVIDFCLSKESVRDKDSSFQQLKVVWASKSNCVQRQGRAGRVQKGYCYRLITEWFYEELREHSICELRRAPLDPLILNLKMFDMGSPKDLLAIAIEPPDFNDILASIRSLKHMGNLSHFRRTSSNKNRLSLEDGELTYLGKISAMLPLDVRLSKLIMFGWVFGVLEDTIIIAACLNDRGLFRDPFDKRLDAFEKRLEWAKGTCSDLFALLHVYQNYQELFDVDYDECSKEKRQEISNWCQQNFVDEKKIKPIKHLTGKIRDILKREEIYPHSQFEEENLDHETRLKFLKLAICGAFFPLYFTSETPEAAVIDADSQSWPPKQTVAFRNFPPGLRIEELACVKYQLDNMFRTCLKHSPKIELHIRDSKLFAVFDESAVSNHLVKNTINKAIYCALKMRSVSKLRQPKIDFTKLDSRTVNNLNSDDLYTPRTSVYVHLDVPMNSADDEESDNFHRGNRGLVLRGTASTRKSMQIDIGQHSLICEPCHAKHACLFFAQRRDSESREKIVKIEEMIKDIQISNKDTIAIPRRMIQKGTVCLAKDPNEEDSDTMYRCEIVDVKGKQCKILFVDYGNTAEVPNRSLKDILPEYEELRHIEFQAFGIAFSNVKPPLLSMNDLASHKEEMWELMNDYYSKGYVFDVVIFSVTDGAIVHGDLYAYPVRHLKLRNSARFKNNPREFIESIRKEGLVDCKQYAFAHGFCVETEESFASLRNNLERKENLKRLQNSCDAAIEDASIEINGVRRYGEVELLGPFSPLELRFHGVTEQLNPRRNNVKLRVAPDSINSIALDENPELREEKMLIAASVQISDKDRSAVLRNTTLIDKQRGYMELVSLMFTPQAKIRVDKTRKYHSSALCGSGQLETSEGGIQLVHEAMDAEIHIGVVFTNEDYLKLNTLRHHLNCLLGPTEPKFRPNTVEKQKAHISAIRQIASKLLSKKRQLHDAENVPFDEFNWCGSSKEFYEPIDEERSSNPPYCFDVSFDKTPFYLFKKLYPQRRESDLSFPSIKKV